MRKQFFAVAMVASVLFGDPRMDAISIDPDPPKAGESATITYAPNKKLRIEYTPSGQIVDVETDANGNVTIDVPGQSAMLITDRDNSAVSAGYSISQ